MKKPLDYLKEFEAKLSEMSYSEISQLLQKHATESKDLERYAMLERYIAGPCYVFKDMFEAGSFGMELPQCGKYVKQGDIDLARAA